MNKLLYIVPRASFFMEGLRGRVTHAAGIAEGFHKQGWKVTIVGGAGLSSFSSLIPNQVETLEANSRGKWFYKIRFIVFVFTELLRALFERQRNPNLVMVRYSFKAAPFVLLIRLLIGSRRSVLEVNSFAFHWLINRRPLAAKLLSFIECAIAKTYTHVYFCADAMRHHDYNFIDQEKCFTVTNGASEYFPPVSHSSTISPQLRLVYMGTLMNYWDFDFLCDWLLSLKKEQRPKLAFFGDGPEVKRLQKALKDIPDVEYRGRFDRMTVHQELDANNDILILPGKKQADISFTGGMSTKIFDYLSYRLPILAAGGPEVGNVLRNNENAVVFNPENLDHLTHCYRLLADSPERRADLAKAAYESFSNEFSWSKKMHQLIEQIS